MSIASNTGPLIALAKINQLALLQALYSHVDIPAGVVRELFAKPTSESRRIDAAIRANILNIITVVPDTSLPAELSALGDGESEAILLAKSKSCVLLVDDHAARAVARAMGVAVTGTAGVVIEAKRSGLLNSVRESLDEMRKQGYWLSDELIAIAASLANE
jgi:predicted nucleic acid-binding protein